MKTPRGFFKPLAIGAPTPYRELPARVERMIHFVPPHLDKVRAKLPEIAPTVDVILANLEDAIPADAKGAALARVKLEAVATEHKVAFKADSTDRALREGVIKAVRGDSADLADKSDGYIEAAFDLAVGEAKSRQDAVETQRRELAGGDPSAARQQRSDSAPPPKSASAARSAYLANLKKGGE